MKSKIILFISILSGSVVSAAENSIWRAYTLYEPDIKYSTIYEADTVPYRTLYNHCSSIEWFDGKLWCVWQGNPINEEGKPGQSLFISRSQNGKIWSTPEKFIENSSIINVLPTGSYVPKQPNLVVVGNELWCVWHAWGKTSTNIRIARLKRGQTEWSDQEIQSWVEADGKTWFGYTSQNPVVLRSGRIIIPAVYINKDPSSKKYAERFAGFNYSDDGGKTWTLANPVDLPGNHNAVWEPYIYEQANGKLRTVVRNMSRIRNKQPQMSLLTATGTGAQKGTPLIMDKDLKPMRIETITERPQVLMPQQDSGHYMMIHHDMVCDEVVYANRENVALFFSRSGSDDFVAGTSLTPRGEIASYAQGVVHSNTLYVSYSEGNSCYYRSIKLAKVSPLPSPDRYYIFPRRKDILDMERCAAPVYWERTNRNYEYSVPETTTQTGRKWILIGNRGTAGVDTDPVDLTAGEQLEAAFEFKIEKFPKLGNLILCSFGDQTPVRIGVPSNRRDQLYVQCADGWIPAFSLTDPKSINRLELTFGKDQFSIRLNGGESKSFQNASNGMKPRFYLGDGYEVDFTESNRDADFSIALDTFKTRVTP